MQVTATSDSLAVISHKYRHEWMPGSPYQKDALQKPTSTCIPIFCSES